MVDKCLRLDKEHHPQGRIIDSRWPCDTNQVNEKLPKYGVWMMVEIVSSSKLSCVSRLETYEYRRCLPERHSAKRWSEREREKQMTPSSRLLNRQFSQNLSHCPQSFFRQLYPVLSARWQTAAKIKSRVSPSHPSLFLDNCTYIQARGWGRGAGRAGRTVNKIKCLC
jgi:hypothetical protein